MFYRKKIKEQFKISIPEPCSEDWNKMTVVDRERKHCSSCEKSVVDFSIMTDDEIVHYFRHANGKTCGRFTQEQLNKTFTPLPETTRPSNWWKAAMLLPLTFFAKNSSAQQNDSIPVADSLTLTSDTITSPESIAPDSSIANVDSLETLIDSTILDSVEVVAAIPPQTEVIIKTMGDVIAQVEVYPTMGICSAPMLTGDVAPLPIPKTIVMGGTGPYKPMPPLLSFLPLWSRYSQRHPNADDKMESTDPNAIASVDPNATAPDPVPPTLPDSPWYEAILPPSLRPRRNG